MDAIAYMLIAVQCWLMGLGLWAGLDRMGMACRTFPLRLPGFWLQHCWCDVCRILRWLVLSDMRAIHVGWAKITGADEMTALRATLFNHHKQVGELHWRHIWGWYVELIMGCKRGLLEPETGRHGLVGQHHTKKTVWWWAYRIHTRLSDSWFSGHKLFRISRLFWTKREMLYWPRWSGVDWD